jgi:hypothetical protein
MAPVYSPPTMNTGLNIKKPSGIRKPGNPPSNDPFSGLSSINTTSPKTEVTSFGFDNKITLNSSEDPFAELDKGLKAYEPPNLYFNDTNTIKCQKDASNSNDFDLI